LVGVKGKDREKKKPSRRKANILRETLRTADEIQKGDSTHGGKKSGDKK